MADADSSPAAGVDGNLLGTGTRSDLVALPDRPGRIRAPVHVGVDTEKISPQSPDIPNPQVRERLSTEERETAPDFAM